MEILSIWAFVILVIRFMPSFRMCCNNSVAMQGCGAGGLGGSAIKDLLFYSLEAPSSMEHRSRL